MGPGRLPPWDYYCNRLYDDGRYGWAQRREFIGDNSFGWVIHKVSDQASRGLLEDKLAAY